MNINLNNDSNSIDDIFIIYNKTGERPNRITIDDLFVGKDFEDIIIQIKSDFSGSFILDNYQTDIIPNEDQSIINQKVFIEISKDIWLSYLAINKDSEEFICNNIQIYYIGSEQDTIDKVNKLQSSIMSSIFPFEEENVSTSRLYTVSISTNGLDIEPISIDPISDIEKYYHSDTLKSFNSWVKKSKKVKSGISFFKGDKGRGKTSILKYLSEKTDRIILFIPTNYLEHTINNPDFKNFLKNSKYLLVIDDAEVVCDYPNLLLINNIHQLVDGILNESIGVQILMIYNGNIPSTISNVNNIIDIVDFKKLTSKQASELSNKEFVQDVNLIDIFKKKKKEKVKISL
jgi:hypothetical protein